MKKKLTKHGNSYALVIDKPILDLLNIGPDTTLEISTDGRSLRVQPAMNEDQLQRLETIAGQVMDEYADVFQKLAE